MFEHGVTTQDIRLTTVSIRDLVEVPQSTGNKPRTRAQTAGTPQQWTTIPVLVKIFKLLLGELTHLRETALIENESENDTEEEEENGEKGDGTSPKKQFSLRIY